MGNVLSQYLILLYKNNKIVYLVNTSYIMNFEDVGDSFAVVRKKKADGGEKNKKDIDRPIFVYHDEEEVGDYFEEYHCAKGEEMQLIPCKEKERRVLYISGASGSGKSYFCNRYIKEYHKIYPKRSVYLFSYFSEDPSITCKYVTRINLEKFGDTQLQLEDFANSFVIFDDIDTIREKKLKDKLKGVLNALLQLGRHHNVEVAYITHLVTNGADTRIIMAESTSLTIFPKTLNHKTTKYLLAEYFGLSKSQISEIKSIKSRHVTIIKSYPHIIMHEKGCVVLSNE
jgi:GTPase SAR1 family protein